MFNKPSSPTHAFSYKKLGSVTFYEYDETGKIFLVVRTIQEHPKKLVFHLGHDWVRFTDESGEVSHEGIGTDYLKGNLKQVIEAVRDGRRVKTSPPEFRDTE